VKSWGKAFGLTLIDKFDKHSVMSKKKPSSSKSKTIIAKPLAKQKSKEQGNKGTAKIASKTLTKAAQKAAPKTVNKLGGVKLKGGSITSSSKSNFAKPSSAKPLSAKSSSAKQKSIKPVVVKVGESKAEVVNKSKESKTVHAAHTAKTHAKDGAKISSKAHVKTAVAAGGKASAHPSSSVGPSTLSKKVLSKNQISHKSTSVGAGRSALKQMAQKTQAQKTIELKKQVPVDSEPDLIIKPKVQDEPTLILTDAEGRPYCKVKECDQVSVVDGYCRYHYLLLWKKIQIRRRILIDGKLEKYIEDLTIRYPDKFLEVLRKDLLNEKNFLSTIAELEIDESLNESEFDDDDTQGIEEVKSFSESSLIEDDDF